MIEFEQSISVLLKYIKLKEKFQFFAIVFVHCFCLSYLFVHVAQMPP